MIINEAWIQVDKETPKHNEAVSQTQIKPSPGLNFIFNLQTKVTLIH